MHIFMKTMLTGMVLFSGNLFAQKTTPKTNPPAAKLVPLQLRNKEDSVQYALGAYMGDFMVKGGFHTIDVDYFLAGLEDIFNKRKPLIADSSIYPIISGYQSASQKKIGKTLEDQLFSSLKDKPGMGKLPSGVQYLVIKPGKGIRPLDTDSVRIQFKGTLPDGSVFENTFAKNIPILTTPATLIPGLNEALQLMPLGASWQLFIPAAQAYGEKGNAVIPPNSAVIIWVELLAVIRKN